MSHEQRRLAVLILAVATSMAPGGGIAGEQEPGSPPPAQEAPANREPPAEDAKPVRQDAPEERRKQKFDARQEQERGQETREDRQERFDRRQERNQERALEKQRDIENQHRQQREEQKARQLEEQKRQQREAEDQRRKEETEQADREREGQKARQLEEQKRQQREAEDQRRKEETEQADRKREEQKARQLEEQQRQQREAERVPAQPEKLETGNQSTEQVQPPKLDSQSSPQPEVSRKPEPPPKGVTPPAVAEPPAASSPAGTASEPRIRREDVRKSYRLDPRQQRSFEAVKQERRERTVADGDLRIIEEPDRRIIVKEKDRVFIRHDESERFRRIAPDARTIRRADGTRTTFMTRRDGIRIYDVTDRHGRLLYRYRRYPGGREVVLIDNRRHYRRDGDRTRDVLIGAGIGLLVGSAIALAAPDIRIPRDEYIVDYGRASDSDLYTALTAPPVDRLDRGYSLEEIRYSRNLRDRMRRIDLDTVTFDFGSWEVGPDQARALDRLADGILRVLDRNPDEIMMIEGHTDAVGSREDNLTLSDRRAQSVAEILTIEFGVPPENLVTQGYGEEQLKIPTDGPERANRRIAVRRIGPLLSGQLDGDRYGGPRPTNNWEKSR